jgi:hypothetical protein
MDLTILDLRSHLRVAESATLKNAWTEGSLPTQCCGVCRLTSVRAAPSDRGGRRSPAGPARTIQIVALHKPARRRLRRPAGAHAIVAVARDCDDRRDSDVARLSRNSSGELAVGIDAIARGGVDRRGRLFRLRGWRVGGGGAW